MVSKKLKSFEDKRGNLLPFEFSNLSFNPKRLFIVNDVPKGSRRGEHAHFKTYQQLICIQGKIKVGLNYGGKVFKEFILNQHETLLIKPMLWDWQEFLTGKDTLLVICSTVYNPKDYITDFNIFQELRKTYAKK